MANESNLNRFIDAQEASYTKALTEIKNGKKLTHWMWYIFPQLKELGSSDTAKFYGIADINEAEEFLKHPILGKRLIEISNELLKLSSDDAHQILGSPDDMKLKSSMTLFSELPDANDVFKKVLGKFYNGTKDDKTIKILSQS